MKFTQDELVVVIEALREYRLRVAGSRRILCEALIFRLGQQLVEQAEGEYVGAGL